MKKSVLFWVIILVHLAAFILFAGEYDNAGRHQEVENSVSRSTISIDNDCIKLTRYSFNGEIEKYTEEMYPEIRYKYGGGIIIKKIPAPIDDYEYVKGIDTLFVSIREDAKFRIISYEFSEGNIEDQEYYIDKDPSKYFLYIQKGMYEEFIECDVVMRLGNYEEESDAFFYAIRNGDMKEIGFKEEEINIRGRLKKLILFREEYKRSRKIYLKIQSDENYSSMERNYIKFKKEMVSFFEEEDIFSVRPFLLQESLSMASIDLELYPNERIGVISLNDRFEHVFSGKNSMIASLMYIYNQKNGENRLHPLESFGYKDSRIYQYQGKKYIAIISQTKWTAYIRILQIDEEVRSVPIIMNFHKLGDFFYDSEHLQDNVYSLGMKKGLIEFDQADDIVIKKGDGYSVHLRFNKGRFHKLIRGTKNEESTKGI